MEFPEDLLYTKDHEWVRIDGNKATVGITAYAASELGDIVYVDIDTVGDDLDEGEAFGSVEAVKTVSDLFMPLAGKVAESNEALEDNPEVVNSDPYGEGWMVIIENSDGFDTGSLLDVAAYKEEIGQ